MRVLCLISLCFLITSCGFDHLTDISNDDIEVPSAAECGSCHVEQYSEWLKTAHAKAFISEKFKVQSDDYQDEECLFCHIPGEVLSAKREARRYNRNEGVTCVSCHLYKQAMHGPHTSGAPFSPHSIEKNSRVDSQLQSSQICRVCHEDTYEQWQQQRKSKSYPTCHGCHGVSVQRPHTRGTNFFSKLLVFFEPEHTVRSHYLIIPEQSGSAIGPELSIERVENDMNNYNSAAIDRPLLKKSSTHATDDLDFLLILILLHRHKFPKHGVLQCLLLIVKAYRQAASYMPDMKC